MSAKFKLKDREKWKRFELDELVTGLEPSLGHEGLALFEDQGVLGLGEFGGKVAPVYLDFDYALNLHEKFYRSRSPKSEPFHKAIKAAKGTEICDLTGGLLGDTLLLLAWGYRVTCFEGNPLLAVLIANAMKRSSNPLIGNLTFRSEVFDWSMVVDEATYFYDPFFYKEKEKTKTSKEMELLRKIDIGTEVLEKPDIKNRVVVKRGIKSGPIWDKRECFFSGKAVRYDRY